MKGCGDVLEDGKGTSTSKVTQWRIVKDWDSHERSSNSRRRESKGRARCSGRSSIATVPHNNSTVRAAESLPAR